MKTKPFIIQIKIVAAVRKIRLLFSLALVFISLLSCSGDKDEIKRNQAFYITMRDKVKIAVDLWLPQNMEDGDKIPCMMYSTRYWRADGIVDGDLTADSNYQLAERFNNAGYALVLVDARGSGASFGIRKYELLEDEVKDYGELADWIIEQPWSNGRVGAYGVSYAGNTAEMLAVNKRKSVRAIAPLFNDFDNFGHLVFPGGLLCKGFLKDWSDAVHNMDMNDICALEGVTGESCEALKTRVTGVKPVDEDHGQILLAAAVEEHKKNTVPYDAAIKAEFRDDPFGPYEEVNVGYRRSPCNYLKEIEESLTPMFIRVGWTDAGTVNGALGRYTTINNPQYVVIGPWDHGASNNTDPFMPADTPVESSREMQFSEMMEFFDSFLKESGTEDMTTGIRYYTYGAQKWNFTETWPPEGFSYQKWYFGENATLSEKLPLNQTGSDYYIINYEATTGRHNRWFTNGGAGDVIYPDRADEDKKLLIYTSQPFKKDTEITGHPIITLYVTSTESDGAFFVYFEDVSPDGRITYITEGQLRAIMRKISDEEPLYTKFGPFHSELRADAMPLNPGEIAELTFDLWPVSVLIKEGHSIRIAIAGADKDSFERYPREGGIPVITVSRNKNYPSHIILPIKHYSE
jgi:putative CocE/NonD family hydrolase